MPSGHEGEGVCDVADGRLINVLTVSVADGSIQTIRSVVNSDKLRHLGYELSDLALIRDTNE